LKEGLRTFWKEKKMSWMTYGIIIIFGAFIVLLIINPKLSCFGKRITSPLYPVLRQKKQANRRINTEEYGFHLSEEGEKSPVRRPQRQDEEPFLDQFKNKKIKTKDYGFHLSSDTNAPQEGDGSDRD
jgi:hypothetical protein